jgi:hypothetical protein
MPRAFWVAVRVAFPVVFWVAVRTATPLMRKTRAQRGFRRTRSAGDKVVV